MTYAKTEYTKPAEKSYALVELNTADSATLEALPGIGTKLSSGIVKYRNLLGGYHSVEQLREVYGMRDSTYQLVKKFFKADATLVKRIAINTATADDLRRHPLLRNPLAKLIVSFREQHGAFKSAADLKQLPIVTDSLLEKLQPYITFD